MVIIKAALLTPFYLSISWVLTITYQLFTDTAVKTVAVYVDVVSPTVAAWITQNIDLIVFIYAFTWIFVLSSVIPSLLLGKKRSILVQYTVCLILAVLALSVQGLLLAFGGFEVTQLFSAATFLSNPILAVLYLSIPYLVMFAIDVRSREQAKKTLKTQTAPPLANPNADKPIE